MKAIAHAVGGAVCAECGEPLGAKGVCVACLLRAGLDEIDEAPTANASWTFGDFEIERREDGSLYELGRGAMGITYRAVDKVLHRSVALKVIEPPGTAADARTVRERFLREARAAAALRHPNVAGVFQFGASPQGNRCYCAMELVEGETLEARIRREGPLKLEVALEIAMQVTRALMAAAERSLVHRDLKPGNIMLAHGDDPARVEVKVIDFGLAKAAAGAGEMELTHGAFVGTPAFASPEQFAGDAVDARSDIYALGVTLWFALTGRLPSAGTTIEEIRQRQAHHKLPFEQLASKRVPAPVVALLRSCLAVDPADRPASARELMRALEDCRARLSGRKRSRALALSGAACVVVIGIAAAFLLQRDQAGPSSGTVGAPVRTLDKGIAVLPFENLSTDSNDAFFADGMQDDILTSVGKIKDLKVIARASVMEYRGAGRRANVREIGRMLGVSHVLEGSVRRAADRVVVNVALIDTQDERQVWSERYERTLSDALSLQGELAVVIARALQASLSPVEQTVAAAKPTDNPEAYLLYLRAREEELGTTASGSFAPAIQLYQAAVELDPNFALAWARLSICVSHFARWPWPDQAEWRAKARAHAEEALRLRPQLGEAHLALTFCYLWADNDIDRALAELARTDELLPNSPEVPLTEAFIYKLQNRYRERIASLRRAEALDPRSVRTLTYLVLTLRWLRDWPEAIRTIDQIAAVVPDERADRRLWARANLEFRLNGDIGALKRALGEQGDPAAAEEPEWLSAARYETAMLERDYPAAGRHLARVTDKGLQEALLPTQPTYPKTFHAALFAVASGVDAAAKQKALEQARIETETTLAATGDKVVRSSAHANLALLLAFLGRKEEAIDHGQRAIDLRPPQGSDSIEKNGMLAALALIYAQTGESDKAIELIEHLLTVPGDLQGGAIHNMTLADLKWSWLWDPLRSDPRFQKILAAPEPRTVY